MVYELVSSVGCKCVLHLAICIPVGKFALLNVAGGGAADVGGREEITVGGRGCAAIRKRLDNMATRTEMIITTGCDWTM